ncbi:MAG: protein-glutamate O-methyltransferase CheR [Actinomycetota bacterium]|nr:protein-glutamate O-methyltransferase CheR [Actinomycetota bacterium]
MTTVSPADFSFVSTFVRTRSAIVLEPGKEYLVASRLLPVARESGLGSIAELVTQLRAAPHGPLSTKVVDAMTTNETSWFRDSAPFQMLVNDLLPQVVAGRAAGDRTLRIWSAASSTGQEAYSIAMLLADWLPAHPGWSASIVGTDINADVVAKASAGRYTQLEVNRGLPASMLVRHFARAGTQWQVSEHLRRMVQFKTLNLAAPLPPMQHFDVVLCRNVLIYFDTVTRQKILGGIARTLRPTGFLVLGAAETTLNMDTAFERVQFDKAAAHRLRSSGRKP